jgi:tRNA(fMet)-specific endonuclease VapC
LFDKDTARFYGTVVMQLRRKGRPIPQNDMWIAATALQHNLTLLTKDTHFDEVNGLAREAW